MTTTEYESDSFGRLKLVILPSTDEVEYTLDWKGRRVEKYDSTVLVKRYIYESDLQLAGEIDISTGDFSEFVYSDVSTSPEYMIKGSNKYRFVKDQLGSIRLVVNAATGSIVQRMDYNEWGKVLADSNSGFQPFGFAGGLYEPQTGLVRFGARDYDPEVGRWTSKDPILFNGGDANLYGYVQNDPVNWIDPMGRAAIAPFIGIGVVVGGVILGDYLSDVLNPDPNKQFNDLMNGLKDEMNSLNYDSPGMCVPPRSKPSSPKFPIPFPPRGYPPPGTFPSVGGQG